MLNIVWTNIDVGFYGSTFHIIWQQSKNILKFLTHRRGVPAQPIYNGYCHAAEKYGVLPRVNVSYGNGSKVSVTVSSLIMAAVVAVLFRV